MKIGDKYIAVDKEVVTISDMFESNCQGVIIALKSKNGKVNHTSLYTFRYLWRPTLLTKIKNYFRGLFRFRQGNGK